MRSSKGLLTTSSTMPTSGCGPATCLELCRSLLSSHSYVLEAIRRTAIHSLASGFCCCQDDFEALDVDQNNAISKAEFLQGFAKVHPVEAVDKSPEQMLAMFDELDHDKSDTVGFGEFCDCERRRS